MKRAVDGQDVELAEKLLEVFHAASLDLLLSGSRERLVVVCDPPQVSSDPIPARRKRNGQ